MRSCGKGFIEGYGCVESVEYLSDLPLVSLNLALVVFIMWRSRPPPESPFDFVHHPVVAR